MERKKASDFPPEVLKLFDGYVHGMRADANFSRAASMRSAASPPRRCSKAQTQFRVGAAGAERR